MSTVSVFSRSMEQGIAIITMDVAGEPVNTWTEAAAGAFCDLVAELRADPAVTGVILHSGKPGNFHSGGNLKFFATIRSPAEIKDALERIHDAFTALAAAPFPTIAAIDGHCLGGGLELALAFTARIARRAPSTVFGLPECTLGLLPGGGGTQRLPRLIGPAAVELILSGKVLSADAALAAGIVDQVVPAAADLLAAARILMQELLDGSARLQRPQPDPAGIDAAVEQARTAARQGGGADLLPGAQLALRAIAEGVKAPLAQGLSLERECFVAALLSNEAKGSMHTFFLKTETDKPQTMAPKDFTPAPLGKAAVLGFGTMGRGIVIEILRRTSLPVVVKDFPAALAAGRAAVAKVLEGMAARGRLRTPVPELLDRLILTTDFGPEFADVDLVIEAVYEDLGVKRATFAELCRHVADDCLIATNTSTIPVSEMVGAVSHPERFAGAHFFSPVWLMQLIEIITHAETEPATVHNLLLFAAALQKRPVVCRDYPGFVVNAMLLPYFLKVYELLEQGVPIEAIDGAMVRFGMPVGPVRLIDDVGIDVHEKGLRALAVPLPATLRQVVADGRAGVRKSGRGFFTADGAVDPGVLPLIAVQGEPRRMAEAEIQAMLYDAFVHKGKELLDRGVVAHPRFIDIAMIWGVGFPAAKGGPLKWADLTGRSDQLFGQPFYR